MDPYLYLDEITKQLDQTIQRIHFLCMKLPYRGVNWTYYNSAKTVMLEWMRQQVYKFEMQEQSGEYYQYYKDLYKVEKKSVEAHLRSENMFHKSAFKTNFTDNFVLAFSQINDRKQRIVFSFLNYISQGYFKNIKNIFSVQEIPHNGQPLEKMFVAQVLNNKHIVFLVTVQQTPVQSNKKILTKLDFTQCIVFLDIITPNQVKQLIEKSHAKTYNKILSDYVKESGYIVNQKMLSPLATNATNLFEYQNGNYFYYSNKITNETDAEFIPPNPFYEGITPFTPNKFYQHKIEYHEKDSYIWNEKKSRWVLQNQDFLKEIESVKEYSQQVSNYVISQCLNFGSADKLVNVLQKIPNFKVKLSSEQSHIISCSGNVVCIGRSGTGKTTCAVLRMFALEMLFKYRLSVYHQKNSKSLEKTRFNPKDIDKNVGIRCLFVTASPVLTNEIRRYYDRLTKQLKEELIKRDEKLVAEEIEKQILQKKNLEKKVEVEINEENIDIDLDYENEKDQVEHLMENHFQNLVLKKEISTDDNVDTNQNKQEEEKNNQNEKITFDDDEEEKLQNEMDKFENLNSMSPHDFPSFMTIRNLIMLIDASLSYPFFKRNKEGKIRGQTAQNTWHNEQKGTLYINNFHKNNLSQGDLKDSDGFPKEDLVLPEDEDDDDEIDNANLNEFQIGEKFMTTIRAQEKKINQIAAQKMKQINATKKMAYEVDFEYFKRFFWKRIQNKLVGYRTLDVHFVWTEIYSIIKGSSQSCFYWSGCNYGLSKWVYQQQQNRLSYQEVDKLYEIYNEYELWKNKEGCYDFMDVVNYIIRSMNYGYNRNLQLLHYIMVDEVQDLPMNILFLMKKIVTNGIFYSGDTAQTIAQGVGFRYGSLKSLFQSSNAQYYDMQSITDNVTIQQLTINFRSHNRILYLANSVIDLLEFFFPETIDRLKKEKSQIDGPKPIILNEGDPELLFCILTGESNMKSQRHSEAEGTMGRNPIEFGCSQVVLVRNQESKKKLPAMLSHALCLTIYEAKGLEFDDVILYNFFEDSTLDPQKWNLLRYIQYQSKYMNIKEYNDMISDQEIERVHRLHFVQATRRDIIEQEWKDKVAHNKLQYILDDKKRQLQLTILNNRKVQRDLRMEELVQQEQAIQSDAIYGIEKKGEKDLIQVVKLELNKTAYENNNISQKDYSQLCLELKQLYVAITRPKNRVIIYDENSYNRQILQEYWETLGCVEVITREVVEGAVDQSNVNDSGIDIKQALLRKSDTNQWKQQGLRMMKMRYYQQAMLCFEKAQCFDYMEQARIFHFADHAKETLEEAQREQIFLDQGIMEYSNLSKYEKHAKQAEINVQMKQSRTEFTKVGEEFFLKGQFKQAAKCFFSALNYQRAADSYLKIDNKKSAAECYYIMQDYIRASELFLEIGEYIKTIECLDMCEQWGKILEILNITKGKMTYKQREIYIKRYAPLALEELVSNIGLSKIEINQQQQIKQKKIMELIVQNQINEEEKELQESFDEQQEAENDKKNKSQQKEKTIQEEINEENEEQDGDDGNDKQESSEKEDGTSDIDLDDLTTHEDGKEKNSNVSEKKESEQSESVMDMDFSIVEKSKSQLQDVSVIEKSSHTNQHDNTSFINDMSFNEQEQSNFDELNLTNLTLDIIRSKNQLSDFDHLSEIDPEDEWLKMETGSIAEMIHKSRNSGIFSCSEFSSVNMIDLVSTKSQMIKTSADIFIQDEIMQQVIRYMSMFSDSFKAEIIKIKSKDALLTSRNEKNDETLTEQGANDLLIDLDNIDTNFLYLILDTLEHYNIFRLAIFVCNRYKLTRKVGRYLVSIAHKFSPLAVEDISLDFKYINLTPEKQKRIEKTMIANIALHNLFEVINPEFLRLKEADEIPTENNSLGIEVYRGLLTLGYWKKILYIMDYKRSLNLAYFFSDFNNYKTIFLTMNKKYKNKVACIQALKVNEPDFQSLPFDIPKTEEEIELAIVSLEHIITFQNSKPKLSKSTSHNLSFTAKGSVQPEGQYDTIPQFPSYFTYNAIFWKYINHKISKGFAKNNDQDRIFFNYVGQCCKSAIEILDMKENFQSDLIKLRIFDIFSFFSSLMFQLQFQDKLTQVLIQHLEFDDFLNFSQVANRVLQMFTSIKKASKIDYLILRALISPLKARLNIKSSDLLSTLSQSSVCVHKSSRLVSHFLQLSKIVAAKLYVQPITLKIMTYEEYCFKKTGQLNQQAIRKTKNEYREYKLAADEKQQRIKSLLLKGDRHSFEEAQYIAENKEDKEKLANYIKEIEFLEKKTKNKFHFLDLDCEFVSAPVEDVVLFLKDTIYKLSIPIIHRKMLSQIKLSGTKNYTIERLFKISAYNFAYANLMKECDKIMKQTDGEILLSKAKDYVKPEYKKYKKSNPLYKFFKLEYLKKFEDGQESEEDEEIQKYLQFEGMIKKAKKISVPLLKKCKRQLSACLETTYQGFWEISLHPYVKNILLGIALNTLQTLFIQISYDLKKVQKYAQLLNLLNSTNYIFNLKCDKKMQKYVNQIIENVYNARNGLILNYVNNTLNIQDAHFDNLEIIEKLNSLEYCAIWSTISYLASKNETFTFHLNQNFLKYLPPLKFTDFTTDQKDDNKISVPSRFALEISVEPIKSLDILVEIFQFINDVANKQQAQIIQRKAVFTKLLSLIFIVLFNIKKISTDLAQEILALIDIIDAQESLSTLTNQIEFWDDLVQSRDEKDIEELIPQMICENMFIYEDSYEKADIVQEIYIENVINSSLTEQVRTKMCKSQILQDQIICSKKISSSKAILSAYNYNKQEMRKSNGRLTNNPQELILLTRLNDKLQIPSKLLVEANSQNTQLFHFLLQNDSLISDIMCNITVNAVFDPLDYHYLLLLLDQADRKQQEYESALTQITTTHDSTQMAIIQKLSKQTLQKKEELLQWVTIQFSKENQDPQIYFLHNKMSIAIKWAKLGYFSDAKKLVENINDNFKLKEAQSLRMQINTPNIQVGNKFKSNKVAQKKKK